MKKNSHSLLRKVVFTGTVNELGEIGVALDDIQIVDGIECQQNANCDFEGSFCSWTNMNMDFDDFDFVIRTGDSLLGPGPAVDHTTGTSFGKVKLKFSANK
jgi:hypothetical protein